MASKNIVNKGSQVLEEYKKELIKRSLSEQGKLTIDFTDGRKSFNIYVFSDLYLGSPLNMPKINKLIADIEQAKNDPNAIVILGGNIVSYEARKKTGFNTVEKTNMAVALFEQIQDKIVAIPIAESIMLLQMESDNFVKNILLFLVGLLTSALMYRFLSLQGNNLSFLREEMKHKLLAVNNIPKTKVEIKGDFERLQKRIEDHFKFIMHIKILLVIANIISACFVIVYSYSCISKHVLSLIQKCFGFL